MYATKLQSGPFHVNIYQPSLPPCSFLFVELRRTPSSIELGRSAFEWSATILDDVPTPRGYPRPGSASLTVVPLSLWADTFTSNLPLVPKWLMLKMKAFPRGHGENIVGKRARCFPFSCHLRWTRSGTLPFTIHCTALYWCFPWPGETWESWGSYVLIVQQRVFGRNLEVGRRLVYSFTRLPYNLLTHYCAFCRAQNLVWGAFV